MVKITINLDKPINMLSEKSMQSGQRALANQALMDTNENFVPMREGWLRNSAILSLDGKQMIWNTPYARKHYYVQHGNYTTPGTGPKWDEKAKGIFMSGWIDAFTKGAGF